MKFSFVFVSAVALQKKTKVKLSAFHELSSEALLNEALTGNGHAFGQLVVKGMHNVSLADAFASLDMKHTTAKSKDTALEITTATYALDKSRESMTDVWRKIDDVTSQYMELKTGCENKDEQVESEMAQIDDMVATKETLRGGIMNQKSSEDDNTAILLENIQIENQRFAPILKHYTNEINIALSFLTMYLDIVENAPCEAAGSLFMLQTHKMPKTEPAMVCKVNNSTMRLKYKGPSGENVVEIITKDTELSDYGRIQTDSSFMQKTDEEPMRGMPAFEDLNGAPDCREAKVDCGYMRDLYSQLWGEHFDSHDTLTLELNLEQAMHDDAMFALKHSVKISVQNSNALSEKAASLDQSKNALLVRKSQLATQKQSHIDDCAEEHDALRAQYQEHLNKFCLYKTVRDYKFEDLKTLNGGANDPADIQDCIVQGNWVTGQCTQPCHQSAECSLDVNKCSPGSMSLTRTISIANRWGVNCPNSAMTVECKAVPCPTDCQQSQWSEWTACSSTCTGGQKLRQRNIDTKPIWGGTACETNEEQVECNAHVPCGNDCEYEAWTEWSECSRQCGGGRRFTFQPIRRQRSGNKNLYTKCTGHWDRMQFIECKPNRDCFDDEKCESQQDIILALDSSGSVEDKFFEGYRSIARQVIKRYRWKDDFTDLAQVGLIVFGDGSITANKQSLSPIAGVDQIFFKGDPDELEIDINATIFRGEITNFKQMFDAANSMFSSNRNSLTYQNLPRRTQTLVVLTDGGVILQNQAEHGEQELWTAKVSTYYVVFTKPNQALNSYFTKPHRAMLTQYLIHYNDKLVTEAGVAEELAFKILKNTCAKSNSQSSACLQTEENSLPYIEISEDHYCEDARVFHGMSTLFTTRFWASDKSEAALKCAQSLEAENSKVNATEYVESFWVGKNKWGLWKCAGSQNPYLGVSCDAYKSYELDTGNFKCPTDENDKKGFWVDTRTSFVASSFNILKPRNCPKVDCGQELGLSTDKVKTIITSLVKISSGWFK